MERSCAHILKVLSNIKYLINSSKNLLFYIISQQNIFVNYLPEVLQYFIKIIDFTCFGGIIIVYGILFNVSKTRYI